MPVPHTSINKTTLQASTLLAKLREQLAYRYPDLLSRYPVVDYVHTLDNSDPLGGYGYTPSLTHRWCKEIEASGGSNALENYHRMVLVYLITDFDNRIKGQRVPDSIITLLAAAFQRILALHGTADNNFYRHSNDLFRKDLALCRLKLLPCGSELVDVYSGVPRSILFRNGLQQLVDSASFFLRQGNGFRPWYESHWDRRLIRSFTPQGYDRCYLHIAELLELNPEVKGMMGSSWWFDPALEAISPNLTFLRKVPLDNGAQLFRVGSSTAATQAAIHLSAERKRLYDAQYYRPTNYLLAWARKDMLDWANRYSS
ncbi:MAG: hypothetical protein WBN48_04010 [Thiogranum sp.]